jgi:hypothetical protein
MGEPLPSPLQELQAVLDRYDHELDEPDAIPFLARVREQGILEDREWIDLLRWLDDAMTFLKKEMSKGEKSGRVFSPDADPRNADWLRLVRAQRLTGYRMPHWASLWLWRIGHDRARSAYWKTIGRVAKDMGFPELREDRGPRDSR